MSKGCGATEIRAETVSALTLQAKQRDHQLEHCLFVRIAQGLEFLCKPCRLNTVAWHLLPEHTVPGGARIAFAESQPLRRDLEPQGKRTDLVLRGERFSC